MEVRNSAAESQSSDQSQPIQETEGDGGASETVGGPVDVVGGGEGVEVELGNGFGGAEMVKKKRGRPPRAQAKSPPMKMIKEEDEDVCFICFDGGSLVLCDRRGCPKAYHPACVKRDEAFFRSKAKWNCGWHICSICQKAAHHMCYTCTYSLCKGCIRKADYVCVRGDKGFCTVCMKTIMLIENSGEGKDEKAPVDFDDKTSWEYLFKVYWVYLKGKLSLTLEELTEAKNPYKRDSNVTSVSPLLESVNNGANDSKSVNLESSEFKRRKTDEQSIIPFKEPVVITKKLVANESPSVSTSKDWATKELLEFVSHMKNGDTSVLSQFDVQELMLEYIKRNNLRDPKKKSQIICDSRLKILFGKPRVGHFEMLKLLEYHFFIKEDLVKNTINTISKQVDPDWINDNIPIVGKEKKRRNHKKVEERVTQNNLDEYAAIDVHNMNLVYLRRKLMENLVGNSEEFNGKVVGSIVRIRITGSDQKHDMYRLVQVVGTRKADKPYKLGNKSADFVLEVLNLDKKETVSIDTISNQDLSEDECRRLRQSIKCGLVKRFTVGEIQDKAVSLQSVRLNDLMEAETLRLNNLRDRASEKGHKKDLREYVEKLQILKTPEERERRLREIPEVHSDPKMNPDYESDDTEEYLNKEQDAKTKPKNSVISHKNNTNSTKTRAEFSNNITSRSSWKNEGSIKVTGRINMVKDTQGSSSSVRPQIPVESNGSSSSGRPQTPVESNGSTVANWNHRNNSTNNNTEMDKIWHYRDPTGKVQGPFCMIQLQKWSTTGYFPVDMRVWMHKEHESLLLNDVLKNQLHNSHNSRLMENNNATDKVGFRIENLTVRTGNSYAKSNESTDLASPTPPENNSDVKRGSSVFDVSNSDFVELPSPTPKTSNENAKVEINSGAQKTSGEWGGYSPTEVKREELNSEGRIVITSESKGDNVESIIPSSSTPPSSQPVYNYFPPFQGVGETIEFSTLAEESVSDLLAEVDAMESQNGFPSPTSRRNSFVEDLFNGSFEEFSPTPSPFRSTTTTAITATTTITTTTTAATTTTTTAATITTSNNVSETNSETIPFKWPEANNSVKVEEKAVKMRLDHNASDTTQLGEHARPVPVPVSTNQKNGSTELILPAPQNIEPKGAHDYREPMQVNFTPHFNINRGANVGWDPHHRTYVGGYNNNNNGISNSPSRINKPWGRQPSFGGGGGSGGVGGGYMRQPPKGQRVCKFFESGRCKKGATCNYWHP